MSTIQVLSLLLLFLHQKAAIYTNMPNLRDLSAKLPELENKTQDVIRDWRHLYDHKLNWTFSSHCGAKLPTMMNSDFFYLTAQVGLSLVINLWQEIGRQAYEH